MTVLDTIGRTSIIPLRHIAPEGSARILLKLEYENPTGSMKDRMALARAEAAEADGRLRPGGYGDRVHGGKHGRVARLRVRREAHSSADRDIGGIQQGETDPYDGVGCSS